METGTHREMRNKSGEILRRVEAGESIQVTNNGRVAALIVPPTGDPLTDLAQRGQVRPALRDPSALRDIPRRATQRTSVQILADSRGPLVTLAYLDTSAAIKLIVEEAKSAALAETLASSTHRLVSSWLLHTERHCAAGRHPQDVDLESVRAVLDTINLVDPTRGDMIAAGTHAPLRSNDAIHLAVAIRLGVDQLFTYDRALADAATSAGLTVSAPD